MDDIEGSSSTSDSKTHTEDVEEVAGTSCQPGSSVTCSSCDANTSVVQLNIGLCDWSVLVQARHRVPC